MSSRRFVSAAVVALLALPVTACSQDAPADPGTLGSSELAPENNGGGAPDRPGDRRARRTEAQQAKAHQSGAQRAGQRRGDGKRAAEPGRQADPTASTGPRKGGDDDTGSPAGPPRPGGTLRAAVSDPAGDVRGALTGAPPYADLTGAALTRAGAFEVRVSFAGVVPQRQSDDRIVQVATFYDVDGDGETDFEVWASLADDGWGTSYRTPDGARYGDDSGVRARPEGDALVITFPLAHLRRADSLSWAVGAQWGTLEQVASGATAQDNAPDAGWARFPG